jgi:hypothetical protein
MHTHTLRNALIALTALSFSITATGCGRQALSPSPPQNPIQPEKKITMMEKTSELIFSDLTLLFIGVVTTVWASNKPRLLYPSQAHKVQLVSMYVISLATMSFLFG